MSEGYTFHVRIRTCHMSVMKDVTRVKAESCVLPGLHAHGSYSLICWTLRVTARR